MRLLVTGSSGFIGSSFGLFAHEQGHEVFGVSRFAAADGVWQKHFDVDCGNADLSRVIESVQPDVILHCAGSASVRGSWDDPFESHAAAVDTLAMLLESIRRSSVRPLIIFPSSAAVYGEPKTLPISEDAPIRPISPYGHHKAAAEIIARLYAESFGLAIVICRLFSTFGPLQRRLLIWELYSQFAGPQPLVTLNGTGSESRDFLPIEFICSTFLKLAEFRPTHESSHLAIFNIASGTEMNVANLAELLRDTVGSEKTIRYECRRNPGDPQHWRADVSKISAVIPGWQPPDLRDALRSCILSWEGISDKRMEI